MNESVTVGGEMNRRRIRWLAIATVFATAAATLTASGGFLLAIPLILGVIAERYSPRRGRWLMWVGAAFLNATLLQMEIRTVPEFIRQAHSDHPIGGLGVVVLPLTLASILMIVWCDVVLLIDATKTRPNRNMQTGSASRVADLLVWITALCFSVYSFWGIPFLVRAFGHHFNRFDVLLTGSAMILIAVAFDVALVIDAAKMSQRRIAT